MGSYPLVVAPMGVKFGTPPPCQILSPSVQRVVARNPTIGL